MPHNQWPGPDERSVVTEMLSDPHSPHWDKCYEFISSIVLMLPSGFSKDIKEDIIHDVTISVVQNLPGFLFKSRLTTWVGAIIRNRIVDEQREHTRSERVMHHPHNAHEDAEDEEDQLISNLTAEEACLKREEWREILKFLQEYIATHAHPERNRQILQMVLFDE